MNMKKIVLGCVISLSMTSVVCNAASLNDVVNIKSVKNIISSDEQATAFMDNDAICRADTRTGRIMEIDYNRFGDSVFGVRIGDEFHVPTNGTLVAQNRYNGKCYFTFMMTDKSLVRLCMEDAVVTQISWLVDVG